MTAWRLLVREATLGVLHGAWLGLLVAAIALVWERNLGIALVLGVAMLGNMIIAGSVGAAVPLFLRRVGVDPAVASAVVVTHLHRRIRLPAVSRHRQRGDQPDRVVRERPTGGTSRRTVPPRQAAP